MSKEKESIHMRILTDMGKDAVVATCTAFVIASLLLAFSIFPHVAIVSILCLFLLLIWGYFCLVWYRIHKGYFGSSDFERKEIKTFNKKRTLD